MKRNCPLTVSRLTLACLWLCFCQASLNAQTDTGTVTGGWRMPLMEDNRMKSLISGESAKPQDDGSLAITQVNIKIYTDDTPPETRLIITAPTCRFNPNQNQASSPGSINLQGAEGSYSIKGRGFLWSQAKSQLSISNAVHTVITRSLFQSDAPATTQETEPITVTARRFDYDKEQNIGTYTGDVEVIEGERFRLKCDHLKVTLPEGSDSDQHIEATGNVEIQFTAENRTTVITGSRAEYQSSADADRLAVTGSPIWTSGEYQGGGETIIVTDLRSEPLVEVTGQAKMQVPPMASGTPPATDPAAEPIIINANAYRLTSSEAVFSGAVSATSTNEWEISSDSLSAQFDRETQAVLRIVGQSNVRITQWVDGKETVAHGSQVQFVPTEGGLTDVLLTGAARVSNAEFTTEGDTIHLKKTGDKTNVDAQGNVVLTLPAAAGGTGGFFGISQTSNPSPSGQQKPIRITADRYRLVDGIGRFENNVLVTDGTGTLTAESLHVEFGASLDTLQRLTADKNVVVTNPDANLTCERLVGHFSGSENTLQQLVASEAVEIRNPNGIATGAEAVFYVPEERMELSGDPEVRTRIVSDTFTTYVLTTADLLIWDQRTNTFKGRGNYRSRTIASED